ncbi:MAG: DUF3572 domain-containing protein [Salinarimonas sp.]|nr:DUF3572 domain-containing protein [Salinarimonas sp.]
MKLPSPDQAQDTAIAVFGRIVADEERLGRFFDLTGLRPDSIRTASTSSQFFEAVLDHVVGYEPLLIAIAGELEMDPQAIVAAHARLAPPPLE